MAVLILSKHGVVKVFAVGGYQGKLVDRVLLTLKYALERIRRNELGTFKVLPKRWVVERTFAWIDTCRMTAKSYERYTSTVEGGHIDSGHQNHVKTILKALTKYF